MLHSTGRLKCGYVVRAQNIKPGTNLTLVHDRSKNGDVQEYSVQFQSYDEIVLFVSRSSEEQIPELTETLPTLDRHVYHIRDYCGRNAASLCGNSIPNMSDKYGDGKLGFNLKSETGEYVNSADTEELSGYVVVSQSIKANSEIVLIYDTDSRGNESSYSVVNQSADKITLTLRKIKETE